MINQSKGNNTIERQGDCVIDYIWSQVKGKTYFKRYYYQKLKDEVHMYINIQTHELDQRQTSLYFPACL